MLKESMYKSLLLCLLLIVSFHSYGMICEDIKSDCEYYSCVEERRHCGLKGYLLGFGRKYCMKFTEDKSYFSSSGQEWVQRVRECLIKKLDTPTESLSCSQFKRAQVGAHVPCYVSSGYCELSRKDRFAVKKVIYRSMWRPSLIMAGIKILAKCKL